MKLHLLFFTVLQLYAKNSANATVKIPPTLNLQIKDGITHIQTKTSQEPTWLNPTLQEKLSAYLKRSGSPIAAAALTTVKDGKVIALIQGQRPTSWKPQSHTAVYPYFPAASIFKTITTIAALELEVRDPFSPVMLRGQCGKVDPRGAWLMNEPTRYSQYMTLARAYGLSCNNFFAKLALDRLGLGVINRYAKQFLWEKQVPADFYIPPSPLRSPSIIGSGAHTVGRYAAGFGMVGLSVMHAAWVHLTLARKGDPIPLKLFRSSPNHSNQLPRIVTEKTSEKYLKISKSTITRGTAKSVFYRWRYRRIRNQVGGKTGTLHSRHPEGLATWFVGMMPIKKQRILLI